MTAVNADNQAATNPADNTKAMQKILRDEIRANQGWISFDRFMELALYASDIGYYSGRGEIFGSSGDFMTAPEITPLFAQTLARAIIPLLRETAPNLLELGAGSGQLAIDLLPILCAEFPQLRYTIVEISPTLRLRQQARLAQFEMVQWCDEVPLGFCGVLVGNEVLDALPVKRLRYNGAQWQEQGVMFQDEVLCWTERATDLRLPMDDPPADYCSEWHGAAQSFIQTIVERVQTAALIFIDYGYETQEYYHVERNNGTLTCFYQHRHHDDPLHQPGAQDLTAHVDFTTLMTIAQNAGGHLLYFGSQAKFLLSLGVLDLVQGSPDDGLSYVRQTQALQKLLSPAEMGQLCKVWIVAKGKVEGEQLP